MARVRLLETEPRPIRLFRVTILIFVLVAGVLAALVLAANRHGGARDSSGPAEKSNPTKAKQAIWIITGEDLELLRRSNSGLARRFFDSAHTFIVGEVAGKQKAVPRGYRSIPALEYPSLSQFENDVDAGRIVPGIGAIIYDPENWSKTPLEERRDPMAAMHRFRRVAAQWGYAPIIAPGRDLVLAANGSCMKQRGELIDRAYLRCHLTEGAAHAEIFVIQSATDELQRPRLEGFLLRARYQVAAYAPRVKTLATLSTNPSGTHEPVWPIDLVRAARAELARDEGILFNFTPPTAPLAASFLRDLEHRHTINGLLVSR